MATPWTYFLHSSLSSVILINSSTESPVHVLMLSIQAVRGLPRLRALGIVPCIIISFSRQLPCFLMVCLYVPHKLSFLPRDATHPRYQPWACVRLSVSVCHKSVFYRNGWTNRAGFWHLSFLPAVLHCVKRKFGYLQNKGTSVWNFVLNFRTLKISPRHIDRRNVLST